MSHGTNHDNVSLNSATDNVTLNNGADNVSLPVFVALVRDYSGSSSIYESFGRLVKGESSVFNAFSGEKAGSSSIFETFSVEKLGESEIEEIVTVAIARDFLGSSSIVFTVDRDMAGVYGIAGGFTRDLVGGYDITLKSFSLEHHGQFSILTGNEQAIDAELFDITGDATPNPDEVASVSLPRILALKVFERQSVSIGLEFRKIPHDCTGADLPDIESMSYTLRTLDNEIINSRENVPVDKPSDSTVRR